MNVNEYGIVFVLGTSYDMSANTGLSLIFTKPDESTLTKTSGVTISASPRTTTAGIFAANTYLLYTFINGDVDQAGDWSVRGIFNNSGGGVHLISVPGYFTVDP